MLKTLPNYFYIQCQKTDFVTISQNRGFDYNPTSCLYCPSQPQIRHDCRRSPRFELINRTSSLEGLNAYPKVNDFSGHRSAGCPDSYGGYRRMWRRSRRGNGRSDPGRRHGLGAGGIAHRHTSGGPRHQHSGSSGRSAHPHPADCVAASNSSTYPRSGNSPG